MYKNNSDLWVLFIDRTETRVIKQKKYSGISRIQFLNYLGFYLQYTQIMFAVDQTSYYIVAAVPFIQLGFIILTFPSIMCQYSNYHSIYQSRIGLLGWWCMSDVLCLHRSITSQEYMSTRKFYCYMHALWHLLHLLLVWTWLSNHIAAHDEIWTPMKHKLRTCFSSLFGLV